MQVKGVSRFVSVELDEIDDFAPEATGGKKADRAEADAEGGQRTRARSTTPGRRSKEIQAQAALRTRGRGRREQRRRLPLMAACAAGPARGLLFETREAAGER